MSTRSLSPTQSLVSTEKSVFSRTCSKMFCFIKKKKKTNSQCGHRSNIPMPTANTLSGKIESKYHNIEIKLR